MIGPDEDDLFYRIGYALGSRLIPIALGVALGLLALAIWRTL